MLEWLVGGVLVLGGYWLWERISAPAAPGGVQQLPAGAQRLNAGVRLAPANQRANVANYAPRLNPQYAQQCGLAASDLAEADSWTLQYLSPGMPFPQRLETMRSLVPAGNWPASARRAYCAIFSPQAAQMNLGG